MKRIRLRRDDVCASCGIELPAGVDAWWDATLRTTTCVVCHPADTPQDTALDVGKPGDSAQREYERRVARREQAIEGRWGDGRLGRFVKAISDDPQSTKAWAIGSTGERRLGERLNEHLTDVGVVLHDRHIPGRRSNIDHLVVAPTGVWVIDAKTYTGRVERRDVGGWFSADDRLYVNNRDRTKLLDGIDTQLAVIRNLVADDTPVMGCLCFVDADWSWFAKPFTIRNVLITWPARLCERLTEPGPLSADQIDEYGRLLARRLPSS